MWLLSLLPSNPYKFCKAELLGSAICAWAAEIAAHPFVTWCDGFWDRDALLVILDSVDADVVLHARVEVLKGAGGLICTHHLLQGRALLPISGSSGHTVPTDAWNTQDRVRSLLLDPLTSVLSATAEANKTFYKWFFHPKPSRKQVSLLNTSKSVSLELAMSTSQYFRSLWDLTKLKISGVLRGTSLRTLSGKDSATNKGFQKLSIHLLWESIVQLPWAIVEEEITLSTVRISTLTFHSKNSFVTSRNPCSPFWFPSLRLFFSWRYLKKPFKSLK